MPNVICQATPTLGLTSIWWSRCCQSILRPQNYGYSLFYLRDGVGGEIAEVRNALVDSILEYDRIANPVSHIWWLDDDVLVFPGCLLELLHLDTDIASGVYFTKLDGNLANPLIYPEKGKGAAKFVPDQVQEVWGHGMGIALIRLEVYKRMRDELNLPKDKYGRTAWYHTTDVATEVSQDSSGVIGTGYTEDLWMLDHASTLGYKPKVVTSKHCFGFHYQYDSGKCFQCGKKKEDHARIVGHNYSPLEQGYPTKQWEAWQRSEPIVWDTDSGPVVWD